MFACIGAVGAIAGATYGTFLILCIPLAFLYDRFQRFFRKSNTAIARLQSVSLSPIYADFSQALAGLNSIRAYDVSKDFITKLQLRVRISRVLPCPLLLIYNISTPTLTNISTIYSSPPFTHHHPIYLSPLGGLQLGRLCDE